MRVVTLCVQNSPRLRDLPIPSLGTGGSHRDGGERPPNSLPSVDSACPPPVFSKGIVCDAREVKLTTRFGELLGEVVRRVRDAFADRGGSVCCRSAYLRAGFVSYKNLINTPETWHPDKFRKRGEGLLNKEARDT